MPCDFTDIESIIRAGVSGRVDHEAFFGFCAAQNLKFDDVCNTIALAIARRFNDCAMTYEDTDGVSNALMIARITDEPSACLPEPAWTIYLAFDAGEYTRGDGSDPVERFTRPLIRQALGGA
jgi:hypothetical protein